jgi:hypothetical protein
MIELFKCNFMSLEYYCKYHREDLNMYDFINYCANNNINLQYTCFAYYDNSVIIFEDSKLLYRKITIKINSQSEFEICHSHLGQSIKYDSIIVIISKPNSNICEFLIDDELLLVNFYETAKTIVVGCVFSNLMGIIIVHTII